jgi:prepilin-type processing-associated H-X9-DG protein
MSDNPYESPETLGTPQEPAPRKWRPRLIELLAVIAVIAVLVALLLPAKRGATEAARRAQCSNHFKQIALALHDYHETYGALPPSYTTDAEGKPLHSWRTLILPFMGEQALYEKVDLAKPWNDPANRDVYNTCVEGHQCLSANGPANHTTYLAVVAPNGCFRPGLSRQFSEITDDHHATLMVIEVDAEHAVHWMSPTDADEQQVLGFVTSPRLSHPGGAHAAFVDGSVRFLSDKLEADKLRALMTVDGNDNTVLQDMD